MSNQNKQLETKLQPLSGQRQSGETDAAIVACNDWLRLGSGRTIAALLTKYDEKCQFDRDFNPPSTSESTLYKWAKKFSWYERSTEYDSAWESRKNEERERVFERELALDYERVRSLLRMARFLESQIFERGEGGVFHNVWIPDVKQIGYGDFSERVDIERFNSAIIQQYRGVLDDIAKETGGRVDKKEHSGPDGGALEFKLVYPDDD